MIYYYLNFGTEGGLSLDSRSADKGLKAVTTEKSKLVSLPLAKKVEPKYQLLRTKSGHTSHK